MHPCSLTDERPGGWQECDVAAGGYGGGVAPILPGDEAQNWHSPSPRLRSVRRAQLGTVAVPAALVALAAGAEAGALFAGALTAGALLAAAATADVLLGRRVRAWAFQERDRDLMIRRGVMFRRLSVIPYGRMQFVDVTAGPFERAFGLASVRMHTAAAASDARVPGLPRADAELLRDHLSALGESQATGL